MSVRVVIQPKGEKGRAFGAEMLAAARADPLWEGGSGGNHIRPVWAVFAGSEQEMKSFTANLLLGRPAVFERSSKIEFLKSGGYAYHHRRLGGGLVTTIYLPELFRFDPGMVDPSGVRFIALPPSSWIAAQRFDLAAARTRLRDLFGRVEYVSDRAQERLRKMLDSDAELHLRLSEGALLLAHLDRKCRYPIPFDPVFGAALLVGEEDRFVFRSESDSISLYIRGPFQLFGAAAVNVGSGFAFVADHQSLGGSLSTLIRHWYGNAEVLRIAARG